MPLIFSYGTLQQESVQLSTFGRLLAGQPDRLPGFESAKVRIDDPVVAAQFGCAHFDNALYTGDETSAVPGMVFEITAAELVLVDEYERRARYTRIAVTLESGTSAWVYVEARSVPG